MNQEAIDNITAAANAALAAQKARHALTAAEAALRTYEHRLNSRLLRSSPVSVQVGDKLVTVTGDGVDPIFKYTFSTLAGPVSK